MANIYKRPIYRVTCWKCRTITDFDYEDIKYDKYGSYHEYWHEFVVCPVCGAATELVDHPSSGETQAKYDTDPFIDVRYNEPIQKGAQDKEI
jgi:hypothetical protein